MKVTGRFTQASESLLRLHRRRRSGWFAPVWFSFLFGITTAGATGEVRACSVPIPPFLPANRHFDRVVVGRVTQVHAAAGERLATVRVNAVVIGTKTPSTVELRWSMSAPCGLTSPAVKSGEDVAVYLNFVSGSDKVEGWFELIHAAQTDRRIVRAAPEQVRARWLELNRHGGGRPIPRGDPGSWVTNEDYPSKALRDGTQGTVRLRASVDYLGRVTSCKITRSSGSVLLDEATCGNYSRRARFRPPVVPEEQTATYTRHWVIPSDRIASY